MRRQIRALKEEANKFQANSHYKTGLQAFLSNDSVNSNNEISVNNVIATGMRRKLKKKFKKLQKQDLSEEEVF